jgi:hypothetical protein
MAYKFQLGAATLSGSLTQEGAGEFDTSLTIGSAVMSESDLEKLDDITNGSIAANKAIVVDGNLDASGFRHFTGTGAVTAGTSFIIGSADLNETDMEKIDGITNGTGAAAKALVLDSSRDIANINVLSAAQISASAGVSGSVIQGTMANFGAGGISTQGNIESVNVSGSGDLLIGGTVRLDGAADTAAAVSADSFYFYDATDDLVKRESMVDYANSIAGNGIAASSGVLAVNPDNASIEIKAGFDQIRVKALGVTNAMLAGSIANAKLVNDSVTLTAGVGLAALGSVDLGASITVAVDGVLEDLDSLGAATTDGEFIVATGAGAFAYESGNTARTSLGLGTSDSPTFSAATLTQLTASYARITELDVVNINSISQTEETLEVKDKLIVSALSASSANSAGGGLKIGGGASLSGHASLLWDHANTALDFNIGGTTEIRLEDGIFRPETNNDVDLGTSGAKFKDLYIDGVAYLDAINFNGSAIAATAAELNIVDGSTSATAVTVNGSQDQLVLNDNGSMIQITAASFKEFVRQDEVATKADGDTLAVGVNYMADMSVDGEDTLTLPASATLTVGQSIKVKAPSDCSVARYITIARAGSQLIDGVQSIRLESPFAAVELVYVAADTFRVF